MSSPWQPEHAVDAALVTRLVQAAFGALAPLPPPVHAGHGWDVDVWRLGELAFRFPRRALGVGAVINELRCLPVIAPRVPLPVPRPLHVGRPAPALGFDAPFWGHAWLPGAPLLRAGLDDAALEAIAAPLARHLRALHAIAPAALRAAGGGDDPRGDVAVVAARGRAWLDRTDLAAADRARAAEVLAAIPPLDAPPAVIHGDCHAGNLLVAPAGADAARTASLTAVIDWGDAGVGDPAVDLAIAWSLPPAARAAFLAAYGPVSAPTLARARVGALSRHGAALLAQALATDDAAGAAFARRTIAHAIAG